MKSLLLIASLALAGCTNYEPTFFPGQDGHSTVTSQAPASAAACPNGGVTISYGLDLNNDKILQTSEVQGSSSVCNGGQGATGATGSTGASGSNGHSTLISQTPANAAHCPTGGTMTSYGLDLNDNLTLDPSEVQGSSYVCNGATGAAGSDGEDGHDGHDGTSVTAVKFCPSSNDSYPSTFPEYGLCVGGKIFAVYWSGSTSFLAYLTPGGYSTTSINSNCSFTVVANSCTIQH